MQNMFFTEKYMFLTSLLCSELIISVTNGFQMNIERLKMCFSNALHDSDLLNYEIIKLDFWSGISKM